MKIRSKHLVDVMMMILFVMMMGYHIFEEDIHEIIGLLLFGFCIVHQLLNKAWYQSLYKGKYTYRRYIITCLNILLILCLMCVSISGLMMSKSFSFLFNSGTYPARKLHLMSSAWTYLMVGLHIGIHGKGILYKLNTKLSIPLSIQKILTYVSFLCAIYGLYAFFQRGLISDMFLLVEFKFLPYQEPFYQYLFDYSSILISFSYIGYVLVGTHRKSPIQMRSN